MLNQLELMTMANHFAAAVGTGHGFSNKSNIVEDGILNRKNVQLFNIGVADIEHECGKINIRNNDFSLRDRFNISQTNHIMKGFFTHTII